MVIFASCEDAMDDYFEVFTLPEGKHSNGIKAQALQTNTLKFIAIFDESAVYQTEISENQYDLNKLLGFADCNSHHHQNSARFAWRWLEEKLEIYAYAYVDGVRITVPIGNVAILEPVHYELSMTKEEYVFWVEGFETVAIRRNAPCRRGMFYMLFPYFGGNEVAPQDITIRIKIDY